MSHDDRAQLIEVIRLVRRRWRLTVVLRGAAIAFAAMLGVLLLSASSLQALRFAPGAIIGLRVALLAACGVLAVYWVVQPLLRSVSDVQVALYLEERDPTLQAAILSAVEALAREDPLYSRSLVDRLVADAVEKSRAFHEAGRDHRAAAVRSIVTMAAAAAIAAAIVVFGPPYLRHGISALLVISRSAEAASPYRIDVRPGNATVPRQSDQAVTARLYGFHSNHVTLKVRPSAGGDYQDVPLVASAADTFEGMLFRLDKPVQYFVESNGVRSPVYSLSLVDLPAVRQLDLEYRFPAYTGLPPQKVESGGDVAALRGTDVIVRVTPTMETPAGQIVLNETVRSPLSRQPDGTLTGHFTIEKQGFYRIELVGPKGETVTASPQYTIDVVGDQAPSVSFVRPGRDTSATPVEELRVEARAEDDFGIRQLDLVYSANGGPEKTVRLAAPSAPAPELSAGHTLYLEELGLKPGDAVSYYARATDNDTVQGPKTATSDIYFVQIRPFRKDYKPAQSQDQMGGGGGGNQVGALSQQQRQIVAATFNTVRDRAKMSVDKFRENVVFLTLAQSKLRQQVDELVQKMASREVDRDPAFAEIAATLPKASAEMRSAESNLQKQSAKEALSPEQRALEYLQQAEQQYETQVGAMRGGGGGGSQADQMADELADLFELELDKLANQYEMQQRASQQGADRQIDELAERLKELARRQQQEAERQRRMAASGGGAAGGGSSQRALADEAEQAARRLEQLTRDNPREDLREAAKQLQQAADAMRRAAANGARDGGAQAAAAQEQLRQAMQRLQRLQTTRADRDVADALGKATALSEEQKQVAEGVRGLPQEGSGRAAQAQKLADRKTAMASSVDELEQQLQKLADGTRAEERDASRKLQEAANGIRDSKLKDKIRYSKGMLQGGNPDYARGFEESIGESLDALKNKVAEAARAIGQGSKQSALNRALDRTRDLERGLASMGRRDRETNASPQQQRAGQAGQSGRPGDPTQSGAAPDRRPAGEEASRSQQPGSQAGQSQAGQAGDRGQQSGGGQPGAGDRGRFGTPGGWMGDPGQFRRDLREWQAMAEEARRRAAEAGVNPRELTDAMRAVDRLDDGAVYDDPAAFEQLRAAALERLRRFELDLLKRAEGNTQPLALSGSDDVPPAYRSAVEEYYRSLSRKQPK